MAGLSFLRLSIMNFFRILWSSFIGLLVYKEKMTEPSQDIESGIPVIPVQKQSGQDKDITRNGIHSEKNPQAPVMDGFVEVSLTRNGTIDYDHFSKCPSRRPSRRITVDPVKSRIMEATLKQVQDKTIDVVKTVNLTSAPIIAMPCSAKIEYYDPRTDSPNIRFGRTNNRIKAVPRAVEFDLPPILVEDTSSPAENEEIGIMKGAESISDLLDLFPVPPTFIPKPLPAVTRSMGQNPRNSISIAVGPSSHLAVARKSGEYSDTESIASMYCSASFSDDTADTSLPGTPTSIADAVMPSQQNITVAEEKSLLSTASSIYRSTETISAGDIVNSKPIPSQNDGIVLPIYEIDESNDNPPMTVDTKNLSGTHVYSQKCDIFDGTCFKRKQAVRASPASIQDMLTTSCSENAVVDSLFAQLETSFELDPEEPTPCFKEKDLFFAGRVFPDIRTLPPVVNPVAPLNIVKKQAQTSGVDVDRDVDRFTSTREDSLEKVLKAFKEAEADDLDFHDLFYRDSSFFSQSSLVRQPQGTSEEETITSTMSDSEICTLEPSEQVDESFESFEQSVEELPATPKLNDIDTTAIAEEQTLANTSMSITPNMEDLISDVVKFTSDAHKTDHSTSNDAANDAPYTAWLSGRPCDDDDDDDETDTEIESEDDQWSNIFELNAYTA